MERNNGQRKRFTQNRKQLLQIQTCFIVDTKFNFHINQRAISSLPGSLEDLKDGSSLLQKGF